MRVLLSILAIFALACHGHSYLKGNLINGQGQSETIVTRHHYMKGYHERCGIDPQNSYCPGPCEFSLEQLEAEASSRSETYGPHHVLARGQDLRLEWGRQNHAGGYSRYSWVPMAESDGGHATFDSNVQGYSCWEVGSTCRSSDNNDPFGGGDPDCEYTIQVPDYLSDGDYTLQWIWYGGSGYTDYYSCVDVTISGGSGPNNAPAEPWFNGGDVHNSADNQCTHAATDAPYYCTINWCPEVKPGFSANYLSDFFRQGPPSMASGLGATPYDRGVGLPWNTIVWYNKDQYLGSNGADQATQDFYADFFSANAGPRDASFDRTIKQGDFVTWHVAFDFENGNPDQTYQGPYKLVSDDGFFNVELSYGQKFAFQFNDVGSFVVRNPDYSTVVGTITVEANQVDPPVVIPPPPPTAIPTDQPSIDITVTLIISVSTQLESHASIVNFVNNIATTTGYPITLFTNVRVLLDTATLTSISLDITTTSSYDAIQVANDIRDQLAVGTAAATQLQIASVTLPGGSATTDSEITATETSSSSILRPFGFLW